MKVNEILGEGIANWLANKLSNPAAKQAVVNTALKNLMPMLSNKGIDVKNNATPIPANLVDPVRKWIFKYMIEGETGASQVAVAQALTKWVSSPNKFTVGTLKKYISDLATARAVAIDSAKKNPEKFNNLNALATTPSDPASAEPVSDIKDTLSKDDQYIFPHHKWPGVDVVVRKSGWYVTGLPPELVDKVELDKTANMYPVLNPKNIAILNKEYDKAAALGKVKEEPIHAL